jgi:YD repeat-containing protein
MHKEVSLLFSRVRRLGRSPTGTRTAKAFALHASRILCGLMLIPLVLTSGAGASTTTTYTYDDAGRLVRVDRDTGFTTSYSLDPAGNRKNVTNSDGTTPTVPTGLTATAISPTQINLSWTHSTDNVGVTGYVVERCQGVSCSGFAPIFTVTGAPPVTNYSDTTATSTTTYSYRVRAKDAAGNVTAPSNVATVTSLDGTPPSAPSALTATVASSTTVNLNWAGATDNVAVTGYAIERCAGAGCVSFAQIGTVTGAPPATSYSDATATQLTTFQYRIRAYDARTNYSPYSNTAAATTPDGAAPSVPAGLTATAASSTAINLSWAASSDNVGVTNYFVERCAGAGCSSFAQIGTVSGAPPAAGYADSALTPASTYTYRVRAGDAASNISGYSASVAGTTLVGVPSPPILSPSNLMTRSTTISLTWTTSSGATSYNLFQGPDGTTFGLNQNTTLTTVTFTTGNGDHFYEVQACNANGCSAMSNVSHILICPPSGCL